MWITLVWTVTMVIVTLIAVKSEWKRSEGVLSKILLLLITFLSLFAGSQIFLKFLHFWG